MTRYDIYEDGEEVGSLWSDGGYGFEYDGDSSLVERVLEETHDAFDVDTEYGPNGAAAESMVEASDEQKAERAASALASRPGVDARPAEARPNEKSWTHEVGPQGADRWRSDSGDIRYRKPAGADEASTDSPNDDIDNDRPVREPEERLGHHGEKFTVMSDEAREEVKQRLIDEAGDESAEDALYISEQWKRSSYTPKAQTREQSFIDALGIDGDARNGDLDGEEPSDGMVEAARIMSEESRSFMRQNYGDEFPVHRGVSAGTMDKAVRAALLGEDVEIEMNPMDNFSVSPEVADHHADGAKIEKTITPDDVAVATDMIMRNGWEHEGEVSIRTDTVNIGADDILTENGVPVAEALEDPVGSFGDGSADLFDFISDMATHASTYDENGRQAIAEVFERIKGDTDEPIIEERMDGYLEAL